LSPDRASEHSWKARLHGGMAKFVKRRVIFEMVGDCSCLQARHWSLRSCNVIRIGRFSENSRVSWWDEKVVSVDPALGSGTHAVQWRKAAPELGDGRVNALISRPME
jgi:hypothetical protein